MFSFAFSVCDPVLGDHGSMVSTFVLRCLYFVPFIEQSRKDHEKRIVGKSSLEEFIIDSGSDLNPH